ncbi:hypothetical protein G9A89_016058 [Geosiphon pyriformis]|nr:hypothetical protein G9A89_016058 [Geosiphon pyriformis]
MVTILINMRWICHFDSKKKKPHRYLDIFLSTDGFSIPSLAKTHSDVRFFTNLILRKAILDKQFLYLVSANGLLRKELKLKANLPKNFSNETIYYPELYGLKSFGQLQAKNLLASVVSFTNFGSILSKLFKHKTMDLQTVSWMPWQLLSFPFKLSINPINCFLISMTNTHALCGSSLVNNILNVFQFGVGVLHFSQMKKTESQSGGLAGVGVLIHHSILDIHLCNFGFINGCLVENESGIISVYTDGSVKGLDSAGAYGDITAHFLDIDLSVEVRIYGLLSLTLAELQAIALA